jgi:hypothetical protein
MILGTYIGEIKLGVFMVWTPKRTPNGMPEMYLYDSLAGVSG